MTHGSWSFACQCQTVTFNMLTIFFSIPALSVILLLTDPQPQASCLLIAWSSFILLGRDSLIRVVDCQQPLEVLHLFMFFCLKCLLMTYLPTAKGMPTVWSLGTTLALFLANLSASSFPGIPCCLGVRTEVSFLDPLSFCSTCILFHTRADLVVVFASAALVSEQIVFSLLCS